MGKMHYFCPNCWEEVLKDTKICPYCGVNIEKMEKEGTYLDKLINALKSNDYFTARTAAYILGEIGDSRAIEALSICIEEGDPYIAAEAVIAIAKIGGVRALDLIEKAKDHPYVTVRRTAFEAEEILKGKEKGGDLNYGEK